MIENRERQRKFLSLLPLLILGLLGLGLGFLLRDLSLRGELSAGRFLLRLTVLGLAIRTKLPAEAPLHAHRAERKDLGETLYFASLYGYLPGVRRLLALGADARYTWEEEGEKKGFFPLFVASQQGHPEVIEALIAGGADPNQVEGKLSASSLYAAAQFNKPGAIAALVKAGADVNLANFGGFTPLGVAAFQGHREALVALLVARAAVNIVTIEGHSPLYLSADKGHVEILKLLIEAKGDVNQCEKKDGLSPLMAASQYGYVEAVKLLLLNGANVHHKDYEGLTALNLAIRRKHPSVEAVLRAHIAKLEADPEAARK